jgi:fused signal recognition particle receptor
MASDKTESGEKPTFFSRLFGRKDRPAETPEAVADEPAAEASTPLPQDDAPAVAPPTEPQVEVAPELPTEASIGEAVIDALAAGSGGEFVLEPPDAAAAPVPPVPTEPVGEKRSWWTRLKEGLTRSSSALGTGITDIFTKRKLDDAMLDELEEVLIRSDLGVATATRIAQAVGKGRYDRQVSPDDVKTILATEVERVLSPLAVPIAIDAGQKPFVILVVGVNGSGKTTTIGKLAAKFTGEGKRVTLAAGDTFRAAAIAQLRIWGERFGCTVIAREQGSDAASLAYEAIVEARDGGADILLMDTAGRLQNRTELMAELEKIIRVMKKVDASAPHAVLLVLDATVGQNAMNQVDIFGKVAGVTGLVMTKLDGTARGGILVAIADKFKLPIHFIGVGETAEDLEPFSARDFAEAIAGVERAEP